MSDRFTAPDAGAQAVAYTCSYHVLRLDDGRLLVLDLVRSDDMGRRGLRAFLVDEAGGMRALIHEAPSTAWAPFATEDRPALDGTRNGGRAVGYAYGRNGVPHRYVNVAPFQTTPLLLGEGAYVELSDLRLLPHRLLDRPALAGSALATFVGTRGPFPGFGPVGGVPAGAGADRRPRGGVRRRARRVSLAAQSSILKASPGSPSTSTAAGSASGITTGPRGAVPEAAGGLAG